MPPVPNWLQWLAVIVPLVGTGSIVFRYLWRRLRDWLPKLSASMAEREAIEIVVNYWIAVHDRSDPARLIALTGWEIMRALKVLFFLLLMMIASAVPLLVAIEPVDDNKLVVLRMTFGALLVAVFVAGFFSTGPIETMRDRLRIAAEGNRSRALDEFARALKHARYDEASIVANTKLYFSDSFLSDFGATYPWEHGLRRLPAPKLRMLKDWPKAGTG